MLKLLIVPAAVFAAALFSSPQAGTAKGLLEGHAKTLRDAAAITITYSVQRVPAAPAEHKLYFGKSTLVRIESPSGMFVSDGAAKWEYEKSNNSYFQSEFDDGSLSKQMQQAGAWVWESFFRTEALKEAKNVVLGAKRTIRGVQTQEVSFNMPGERSITFYIDTKLGIARGALIKTQGAETLILASEISISAEALPGEIFKFVPPEGAEKLEKPKEKEVRWADVSPIFNAKCTVCHGTSGGLTLTSHQEALRSRAIVPGDPAASSLISSIKWSGRLRMPQNGPKLPQEEIDLIEKWVAQGAK